MQAQKIIDLKLMNVVILRFAAPDKEAIATANEKTKTTQQNYTALKIQFPLRGICSSLKHFPSITYAGTRRDEGLHCRVK